MGLRRGQRHSGQFQSGYDARRHTPRRNVVPGTNQTLPELCRLETLEALKVIKHIVRNKSAPIAERRKAADSLLDRGWGKPDQLLKVEADVSERNLKAMTTTELLALLMERDEEERTLEGELEQPQLEGKNGSVE